MSVERAANLLRNWRGVSFLGFQPTQVPWLIFDGESTWLLGHQPLTDEWTSVGRAWRYPGRFPALVANSTLALEDGTLVASILAARQWTPQQLAAVIAHEAFHVWQARHFPSCLFPDENDGWDYPRFDPAVLHTQLEETVALRQALRTGDREAMARALHWQARRHALLSAKHRRYEQQVAVYEGLAYHIECRVSGSEPLRDPASSATMGVRHWLYGEGAAFASWLEQFGREWQHRALAGESLHQLIAASVLPASKVEPDWRLWEVAETEVRWQQERTAQALQHFEAQTGTRLTVQFSTPLSVCCDPMNLICLPDGSVLHMRLLQGHELNFDVDILGGSVRCWGPSLFQVKQLEVRGLTRSHCLDGQMYWQGQGCQIRHPVSLLSTSTPGTETPQGLPVILLH